MTLRCHGLIRASTWSLSPSLGEIGRDPAGEVRHHPLNNRVVRRRSNGRGMRTSVREFGVFSLQRCKLAASLSDTSLLPVATIDRAPTFRQPTRAGLKELIGRHAERVRDFVEVLNLDLGDGVIQKFINPGLRMADPFGETRLINVA